MLSAKTFVASTIVGAMSAEAFLSPAMPTRWVPAPCPTRPLASRGNLPAPSRRPHPCSVAPHARLTAHHSKRQHPMRRYCTHHAVGGGLPRGGGVVAWLHLPAPTRAAGHSAVLSAPALAAGVLPAATHGADVGAGPLEQGSEGGPARACGRVRVCKGRSRLHT